MSISESARSASPSAYVELYTLDCTPKGGEVLRFTSTAKETGPIVFDGNTYTPVPIVCNGFEWSGQGVLPRPKLRISNVKRAVTALVLAFDDLLGLEVTRLRTHREYLDGEPNADPTQHYPIDLYRIERKLDQNKFFVEFELASPIDQQGQKIPRRKFLKRYCQREYRRYDAATDSFVYADDAVKCPYEGTDYFDKDGNVTVKSDDACSHLIESGCKKRFPNQPLPGWFFPGMTSYTGR